MTSSGQVHWEEGLFLQQHHLQLMQRERLESESALRRLYHANPYGVVELQLSVDELENLVIRFDRLRVMMPSGVFVQSPGNVRLATLDIANAFAASAGGLTVMLGIPIWYADRGNTVEPSESGDEDWRTRRQFRVEEVQRPDENTGENSQPVRVRLINARLLIEGDDQTDLEVIPLLRIVHGEGEEVGQARIDRRFAPPCVNVAGSPVVAKLARDIANAVESSRRELVVQLTRGGFSIETLRGIQFEQMLRLQILSRYSARLQHLLDGGSLPTGQLDLELRTMLAELTALHPNSMPPPVPVFEHDAPLNSLADVDVKLRSLLKGAVAASFMKIEMVLEDGMFVATLTDEHVSRAADFYLGMKSKEDAVGLARLVSDEDRFKMMPRSLSGRAIRGMRLAEERVPPVQLPAAADLHYFRIARADNQRMWDRVVEERSLTVRWPNADTSGMGLTLYMTVADGAGASAGGGPA